MPECIPKPCRKAGCPLTTIDASGYCHKHLHLKKQVQRHRRGRDKRPSACQRGYDRNWSKARKLFLIDNPLCVRCADRGLIVAAQVVDHIEPHRGDRLKFWDRDNWQALCTRCHNQKTASEDRVPSEAWY